MEKRDQREWKKLITNYEESGKSQQDWCEANGINLHTFKDRLCKMKKAIYQTDNKNPAQEVDKQKYYGNIKSENGEEAGWVRVVAKVSEKETAKVVANEVIAEAKQSKEIQVKIGKFTIVAETNFEEVAFCKVCKALVSLC